MPLTRSCLIPTTKVMSIREINVDVHKKPIMKAKERKAELADDDKDGDPNKRLILEISHWFPPRCCLLKVKQTTKEHSLHYIER